MTSRALKHFPRLLELWIALATAAVVLGWGLSLAGELNLYGYIVGLGLTIFAAILLLPRYPVNWRLSMRRFSKPLPLIFAAMAVLVLLGGIIYPPNNYDALTYRVPRMLHWLAQSRWHWINTVNDRMNYSAPDVEWITAPLFVFIRTDRIFFVLNFISFLLIPGLVFSTYRMLGVQSRVAWRWMWILPASYCFVFQAGSIGNDAIGAVFVLASLYFGLRATRTNRVSDIAFSTLAIALATGIKATNLPLVLPWIVSLWPARQLIRREIRTVALCGAIALAVSYVPMGVINHHFTGAWMGDPQNLSKLRIRNPLAGFLGNSLELATQTIQPPLLPNARHVQARLTAMLPSRVRHFLDQDYPRFQASLGELPQEEAAGVGIGVAALLFVSVVATFASRDLDPGFALSKNLSTGINIASVLAFLVFMMCIGSEAAPRLLSPYYLVLAPLVLTATVNRRLVSRRWWNSLAIACSASSALALILTPARPLWPAETVLQALNQKWPNRAMLVRAREVYALYRQRNDLLGPLREYLPTEARQVLLIADADDSEVALWRPFGKRKVINLTAAPDWRDELWDGAWIIGKTELVQRRYGISLEELARDSGGQVIAQEAITSKASTGPEQWFVLKTSFRQQVQTAAGSPN